ncbi:MAG: DUF4340 domain-containing protein [Chloroflexi bacterium]|nr:DUF4340 domain-containing protein [Chloroflexota bacterium]
MSQYRNTIIMVLVLAALLAFVVFNDQQQQQQAANAPLPTPAPETLVLDRKADDVTQIAVTTPFSRTVVRRSGEAWQIAEPVAEDADPVRMSGLAAGFARLRATRALTDTPANMAPFGLVTGTLTLTVQFKDNQSETVRFGNAVIGGGAYYAQRAGDTKVYLVAAQSYNDAQGLLTTLPKKPTPAPTMPPLDTPAGTPQGPPLPPAPTPTP